MEVRDELIHPLRAVTPPVHSGSHCFVQLLGHARSSQSEVEQISVILTCTILPGSGLKAFHSLLMVHDPILHRNLGHRHSAKS